MSHQGSPALNPPQQPPAGEAASVSQQQSAATPESFASAGLETPAGAGIIAAIATAATAPATAAATIEATAPVAEGLPAAATVRGGGGVEETKGGEWNSEIEEVEATGFPETGQAGTGLSITEEPDVGGLAQELGLQLEAGGQEGERDNETGNGGGGVACNSSSDAAATGSSERLASGVQGGPVGDPESTQQEGSATPVQFELPHVNGGSAFPPPATLAPVSLPTTAHPVGEVVPGEERNMDAQAATVDRDGGAGGGVGAFASATAAAPSAGAAAAAAPTTTAVTEPHLKTGGQPLTHANRAQSPTGMATDLQDKLKALKLRRKHRFVTMRIEGTEVVAETVAAPGEGPAELKLALPYSDCRYAVYDQEIVTADGRKANKLFFFTWIPHNATPHNKVGDGCEDVVYVVYR